MSPLTKITSRAVHTVLFAVLTTASALAATAFTPVPHGFVGTPFRGVALGQTRAEVEAALVGSGFRCLVDGESKQPEELSKVEGTTCDLVRTRTDAQSIPFERMLAYSIEQWTGIPMQAITFVNDRASAISVAPDFFNAAGMAPYDFAKSIIANYPLSNGLDSYGQGWRGVTDNGEQLVILPFQNGHFWFLMVTAATASSAPSFN